MLRKMLLLFGVLLLITGCSTGEKAVRQPARTPAEEEKEIVMAPSGKRDLFEKAKAYLQNRDYANSLINIIRAENAEGDDELTYEIREFKNNLIEKLNARAMHEKEELEIGKGLKNPLQYMVFYMDEEVIYPAFNIPVAFAVIKGEAGITERGFTNTNGIAECEVGRIESLADDEVVIQAGVYFHIEGEVYTIAKLEREFPFRYSPLTERTISFVVFEKNIDEIVLNSTSGKLIEDFFIKKGFSVVQGLNEENGELFMNAAGGDARSQEAYRDILGSDLIAFTYIKSRFSSRVDEDFYFTRANIILNIIDVKTNEIILNAIVEDVKGAGSTEVKAGRDSITKATKAFIGNLEKQITGVEP